MRIQEDCDSCCSIINTCILFDSLITVELLNSSDVIIREPEVLSIGVDGSHECSRVLGVLQAQSVAKLMSCHEEQTVAWWIVNKDWVNTAWFNTES